MRISRNEWEALTGFDEDENFNYEIAILDEEGFTKEYETHQAEDGMISFEFDGPRVWVSALVYVPSIEKGHLPIPEADDGYGVIESWSFDARDNIEGYKSLRVKFGYESPTDLINDIEMGHILYIRDIQDEDYEDVRHLCVGEHHYIVSVGKDNEDDEFLANGTIDDYYQWIE